MREIYEFRIPEAWACEWLEPADGKKSPTASVRIVTALKDSALYYRVLSADAERRKFDERLFLSWFVRREYDSEEIAAGELFLLDIINRFEPAGEEFGAVYLPDATGPAEFSNRIGPLVLQCSRFRGKTLCQSIAGEKLVAPELQTHIRAARLTGVKFGPIICKGAEASKHGWAELIVTSKPVSVSRRTLTGEGPLNFGPSATEGNGENIGLNVLSEVFVERETWDGSDFAASKQTVGAHQGYLRPRRLLFVSKRMLLSLPPHMRRGLGFEVVRFASP